MTETAIYLVFSNPTHGNEEEFNRWYDEVHVPEVLATPGVVSAQRYKARDTEIVRAMGMEADQGYLLIYELAGDPNEIMAAIQQRAANGLIRMNDALDLDTIAMSFWNPIGPLHTSDN